MPTLLVIDDEPGVQYSFQRIFEEGDIEVVTASTAAEGLSRAAETNPDVVLLDLQLPDRSGLEVFQALRQADPRRPVIFITAHGTTAAAIEAMKHGAFDYLVKPVDLDRLLQVLERAWEAARLMRVPAMLPAEDEADQIIGRSAVMQEMCKLIGRLAPQDVNVLIVGESGTGKELVARALHNFGLRKTGPFVAINMAAIPRELIESELFGHEKGAFTGASAPQAGKFEQANGGTLLLDEISELPAQLQPKLLRVLQEREVERVGGRTPVALDLRVLAATNRDLAAWVRAGRFREDLYYRLNVFPLEIPPLRARRGDIAPLARHFLKQSERVVGRGGFSLAVDAVTALTGYGWPGNIRELGNVVQRAMILAPASTITAEHLMLPRVVAAEPGGPERVGAPGLKELERATILGTLRRMGGSRRRTAEALNLSERTLRHKLKQYREAGLLDADDLL